MLLLLFVTLVTADSLFVTKLRNSTGWITPPGYNDGLYLNSFNGYWVIYAGDNEITELVFVEMDIEFDESCRFDYLDVMDGDFLVGTFCGTEIPDPIVSEAREMLVWFVSDWSVQGKGFKASYRNVKDPICGFRAHLIPGSFGSMEYNSDGLYDPSSSCLWTLNQPYFLPSNYLLKLYLTDLDIQQGDNCQYDYVEVLDNGVSVGRYCGSSQPPVITSSSDILEIRFVSDGNTSGKGFTAYFTAYALIGKQECGGILSGTTGEFHMYTDDLDENRFPAADCRWVIVTERDAFIEMRFLIFDLLGDTTCPGESVSVYDGVPAEQEKNLIGRYCGVILPDPVRSSTRVLSVLFKNAGDERYLFGGFSATCLAIKESVCVTQIIDFPGRFGPTDSDSDGLYDSNLSCTWALYLPSQDGLIQLYLTDMDIQQDIDCQYDYVEVLDNGISAGRYCGSTQPPVITSSSSTLEIRFKSDGSINGKGFDAYYTLIDTGFRGCGGILTEPAGVITPESLDKFDNLYHVYLDCHWLILAKKGNFIRLNFTAADVKIDAVCCDFVSVYDGDFSVENALIGTFYLTNLPYYLTCSTTNVIRVHLSTDSFNLRNIGFAATYMFVNAFSCAYQLFRHSGRFGPNDNDLDGLYDSNLSCSWALNVPSKPGLVQLYVTDLDIQQSIDCQFDYVEVLDNGVSLGKYCGSAQPPLITSSSNTLEIRFESDDSINGRGFVAYYTFTDLSRNCGGILSEGPGMITSVDKDGDGLYDNDLDCIWLIIADKGSLVELKFSQFDLEEAFSGCETDSISIYDGDFSDETELIGTFCGTNTPYLSRSTTNMIRVYFRTDFSSGAAGFTATYVFLKVSDCYNQYSDMPGRFGLTDTDPDGLDGSEFSCTWFLLGSEGKLVQIYLTGLDIEERNDCQYDYIEVLDRDASVGKYCGSSQPPVITSSSRTLEIRFKSDGGIKSKGFIAYYADTDLTGRCGGILTEPLGEITSVNKDDGSLYQNKLDCRWLIIADTGSVVELTFHTFDVEKQVSCGYDYVLIYDGVFSDENNTLGRYCGQDIPVPVISEMNVLRVQFKTDNLLALTGFNASYKHIKVNETTTQSVTDDTYEVTSKTTMSLISPSHTEGFTDTLSDAASISTADTPSPETADTKGSTITEEFSNPTNYDPTHSILATKHLTKKTSVLSESTEIHTNAFRKGTTKLKTTVTEGAIDTGPALDTTDRTVLTSFQSEGAAEKSVAAIVSKYVPLLACFSGLVNF